jgi:hypothetical protein
LILKNWGSLNGTIFGQLSGCLRLGNQTMFSRKPNNYFKISYTWWTDSEPIMPPSKPHQVLP